MSHLPQIISNRCKSYYQDLQCETKQGIQWVKRHWETNEKIKGIAKYAIVGIVVGTATYFAPLTTTLSSITVSVTLLWLIKEKGETASGEWQIHDKKIRDAQIQLELSRFNQLINVACIANAMALFILTGAGTGFSFIMWGAYQTLSLFKNRQTEELANEKLKSLNANEKTPTIATTYHKWMANSWKEMLIWSKQQKPAIAQSKKLPPAYTCEMGDEVDSEIFFPLSQIAVMHELKSDHKSYVHANPETTHAHMIKKQADRNKLLSETRLNFRKLSSEEQDEIKNRILNSDNPISPKANQVFKGIQQLAEPILQSAFLFEKALKTGRRRYLAEYGKNWQEKAINGIHEIFISLGKAYLPHIKLMNVV